MKKNFNNIIYFLIWCVCTISLFSAFKIEKVQMSAGETAKNAITLIASKIIKKLVPSGSKNYIFK